MLDKTSPSENTGRDETSTGKFKTEPLTIPDFDKLSELARNEPNAYEILRLELCQQFISEAPIDVQRRLEGLQFRIDMERRRSGNPIHSCIKLSAMMNDSLQKLGKVLSNPEEFVRENEENSADILPFPPSRE